MPGLSRSLSPGARTRSPWVLVLGILVALTAAACRTDVDVLVAVDPAGSGKVTVTADLDADAAAQLGDPSRLVLTDLADAGWDVDGPTARRGGLRVVAVRRFSSPEELSAVLDEVGGAGGVFSDTSLVLGNGLLSDSTEFRTRLHLTGDPAQFSDEQLAQVLGGLPLGRTPEELAAEGFDSADAATLTVRVALPDGVDESNGRITKGVARWSAPLAGGTSTDTDLRASASTLRTSTLVLVALGAVLLVGAAVVAVIGAARRD